MKNLRKCLYFAAFTLLVATAFTSCLDSDGDNFATARAMDDMEKAKYMAEIAGEYTGDAYCTYVDAKTGRTLIDTVHVSWYVAQDKTVEVTDFPDAVFARQLDANSDVAKALGASQEKRDMEFDIAGMFLQEYSDGSVVSKWFTLDTKDKSHAFNVSAIENGTEILHPVEIGFGETGYHGSSIGVYDSKTKNISIEVIVNRISVDGKHRTIDEAILFTGNKR